MRNLKSSKKKCRSCENFVRELERLGDEPVRPAYLDGFCVNGRISEVQEADECSVEKRRIK